MNRISIVLALCLAVFPAGSASATVGLAEWEVLTPGGNAIRHSDGFKELHGDCITANPEDPALSYQEKSTVYVSHLRRWRYYEGFVAGERNGGFFLFDEKSKEVRSFSSDEELAAAITAAKAGAPLSAWLTAGDGHREAWFPYLSWRPCQFALGKRKAATPEDEHMVNMVKLRGMKAADCQNYAENFPLYRRTTWGRGCREAKVRLIPRSPEPTDIILKEFCEELLGEKIELKYDRK